MEPKKIIAEILKHNRELSKSSRFYKLTHEEQAEVIINSETKFKTLGLFSVVKRYSSKDMDEAYDKGYSDGVNKANPID